jgi:hypothetical protein
MAVDDVRDDDEEGDEVDATHAPQAFPESARAVHTLVDTFIAVVGVLMMIASR